MKCLARRISLLEQHQGNSPRRIHIVTAVDEPDRDRKMADLVEAGVIGARDGFLCLLGKPRRTDGRARNSNRTTRSRYAAETSAGNFW